MKALASFGAVLLLVWCLTGCTPAASRVASASPTAKMRSTPLGEAQSVWRAYFKLYTSALSQPDVRVEDMRPYLTTTEYKYIANRIGTFRDGKYRVEGDVSTRSFEVLKKASGGELIQALVCVDNESSRILDSKSVDVTPTSRQRESTLRVTFVQSNGRLLLDGDEVWKKSSVC